MNRRLVRSDADVVKLLLDVGGEKVTKESNVELTERELGIEFILANGHYASDLYEKALDPNIDDDESDRLEALREADINLEVYRKTSTAFFPATYPAIAIYRFEGGYDRLGSVSYRLLLYVELKEFTP